MKDILQTLINRTSASTKINSDAKEQEISSGLQITGPKADYREYILLALILGGALVLRLAFIHVPLDRDEGWYGYIGQELLRGSIPYRDVFDQKPPGVFYIYAAIVALFGSTVESVRLATAGYVLLTLFGVYRLARYCHGRNAALLAALLYGIYSSGPIVEGFGSNTEVFMVLPVVASSYFFLHWLDRDKPSLLILSGCLAALAGVIKTVALPFYLLLLCFIVITRIRSNKGRSAIRDVFLFLFPSALLLFVLYVYLSTNNAWDDFFYWNITFNKQYGQASLAILESRLLGRGMQVSSEHLLLWVLALPTSIWLLSARRDSKNLFLVLLILESFIGVAMPGKFWAHYFILMIAPLSIIAGIGLACLFQRRGWLLYCALPFLTAVFLYSVQLTYKYYLVYSPEEVSATKFGNPVFVTSAKVAAYIKARTAPTDYIFQWGWEPEIYFLSNRRSPNKIITHTTISVSRETVEALVEMVTSIVNKKPKYIIIQGGREQWTGYNELSAILTHAYHLETEIDGMSIYRHL
jgi:4-amino-4-deoxy-L-arabinose transferase-like glycosyltransferase